MQGGTPQARKLLELEQTMVKELKQQNFEEALDAANAVLANNPNHKRGQEFSKLLQELIARREEDTDSSSGSGTEAVDVEGGGDQARGEGSEDEESSSSSSSDEGESDEDDEGDEENGQEQGKSQPGPADAAAARVTRLSLNASNMRTNHTSRKQLRESIGGGLKALREKEQVQKLVESDPLLGS
ncbi:hypothetical protein DUNSADRAFT_5209 [Dunaliella salina]|uniref:Uncharacterized protein n=1 Tax=Dunaliella salina TaxID=3046 RepID=A0ABQ7GQQ2_DUNSA|nr:hypothetical protein DUNSADRAFT_5209 [Dunaliella salina]|eukprot:KAF5836932.1 hypothetical protein DUNSADRAFT_5209 [Dunaliella salina]